MDQDRTRTVRTRILWLFLIIAILLIVIFAVLISRQIATAAPEQPIAFKHQVHAEAEVSCLFCHPNALRSDIAGIPSVARCVGCHQTIASDSPDVKLVLDYWERNEPIPWRAVNNMPDFVFFSHQPHLGAGVSCETCHGNVGEMVVAKPVISMDMGWCLDCHLDQPKENVARLSDCLACHK